MSKMSKKFYKCQNFSKCPKFSKNFKNFQNVQNFQKVQNFIFFVIFGRNCSCPITRDCAFVYTNLFGPIVCLSIYYASSLVFPKICKCDKVSRDKKANDAFSICRHIPKQQFVYFLLSLQFFPVYPALHMHSEPFTPSLQIPCTQD